MHNQNELLTRVTFTSGNDSISFSFVDYYRYVPRMGESILVHFNDREYFVLYVSRIVHSIGMLTLQHAIQVHMAEIEMSSLDELIAEYDAFDQKYNLLDVESHRPAPHYYRLCRALRKIWGNTVPNDQLTIAALAGTFQGLLWAEKTEDEIKRDLDADNAAVLAVANHMLSRASEFGDKVAIIDLVRGLGLETVFKYDFNDRTAKCVVGRLPQTIINNPPTETLQRFLASIKT